MECPVLNNKIQQQIHIQQPYDFEWIITNSNLFKRFLSFGGAGLAGGSSGGAGGFFGGRERQREIETDVPGEGAR